MKQCPYCGTMLYDNAVVCNICGFNYQYYYYQQQMAQRQMYQQQIAQRQAQQYVSQNTQQFRPHTYSPPQSQRTAQNTVFSPAQNDNAVYPKSESYAESLTNTFEPSEENKKKSSARKVLGTLGTLFMIFMLVVWVFTPTEFSDTETTSLGENTSVESTSSSKGKSELSPNAVIDKKYYNLTYKEVVNKYRELRVKQQREKSPFSAMNGEEALIGEPTYDSFRLKDGVYMYAYFLANSSAKDPYAYIYFWVDEKTGKVTGFVYGMRAENGYGNVESRETEYRYETPTMWFAALTGRSPDECANILKSAMSKKPTKLQISKNGSNAENEYISYEKSDSLDYFDEITVLII